VNEYYGEATMAYAEPVLWLWSLLMVPLTTIFIDWAAYFARYCLCPTQEMLFREFELQVSGALFCLSIPPVCVYML
jgi:hypothetical protein